MDKRPVLHEIYQGYVIYHRPWLKRRPWRVKLSDRRGADHASLEACKNFIDRLEKKR
jgi:hypothetical protein